MWEEWDSYGYLFRIDDIKGVAMLIMHGVVGQVANNSKDKCLIVVESIFPIQGGTYEF